MSDVINIDIAKCICDFLDKQTLTIFVSTCKTFYSKFQYLAGYKGYEDVELLYVLTSQLIVNDEATKETLYNIMRSDIVIYNREFDVLQTISIQQSTVIFVNCKFRTKLKANVFYCTNSKVTFTNCEFDLSNKLGKCITSKIRMTNCMVSSKMTTHPLLILRMSSVHCDTVTTQGGNVFCFINGRPDSFSLRNCHCSSDHGVEWHNCRMLSNDITDCNSLKDFSVFTTNTNHFCRSWLYQYALNLM